MTAAQQMKVMLRVMVEALVDDPERASVEMVTAEERTTFRVAVAGQDVGKVIGANGRTARSLRIILYAVAAKHKLPCSLDIVEG